MLACLNGNMDKVTKALKKSPDVNYSKTKDQVNHRIVLRFLIFHCSHWRPHYMWHHAVVTLMLYKYY
jgi:hypothetical protein